MFQFHGVIRSRTRAEHDHVDTLFGAYDLTSASSYADMLQAHARALLPVEAWLAASGAKPLWTSRAQALRDDLAALGVTVPDADPVDWPASDAAAWGTAYVLEGSRLGGAMLARQVGEGLPRAYLGDVHQPGGWKAFLAAFEGRAEAEGPAWQEEAIAGAQRAFAAFAGAVPGRPDAQ